MAGRAKALMDLTDFKERYHIKVNEQQEKAMCRVDGPTLLLAVPGSGKTTVIVSRTGYMLYCAGIPASSILNLTFSVAAAREMETRFRSVFGHTYAPTFSTIHSFCLKVIRYCKSIWGIHVPELEPVNERIIRRVLNKLTSIYPSTNSVREIQSALTLVKNRMMSDDEAFSATTDLGCLSTLGLRFMDVYKAYEADKAENGLMDFDDQLAYAYELLTQYPDALNYFQEQYTHISVDEAQDTSKIQHEIIRTLASKSRNLFMVGDDDQSIYRFRGAVPAYLLDFEHVYKDAVVLNMDINYRSDKKIISQADQFIQDNKERFPKHITSNSDDDGVIDVVRVFDMIDQYDKLYQILKDDMSSGKTTAVLYRNNDSVLPLLDVILRAGKILPVRCHAEPEVFLSSPLADNLFSILRFAADKNTDDFLKIYYRLGLFLNKATALKIVRNVLTNHVEIMSAIKDELPPHSQPRLAQLTQAMLRIRFAPPETAIDIILESLSYAEQVKNESEFSQQKLDILRMLAKPCATTHDFLNKVDTWKAFDHNTFYNKDSNITLSTMHSAKGLEFDHVIIMDATDLVLPCKMSYQNGLGAEYEEEARLFYVGVTRAKHQLTFLTYESIFGTRSAKSRFIDRFIRDEAAAKKARELEAKNATASLRSPIMSGYVPRSTALSTVDFKDGTRVSHDVFGSGVVQTITPTGIIVIGFDKCGTKKLMLDVCIKNGVLKPA